MNFKNIYLIPRWKIIPKRLSLETKYLAKSAQKKVVGIVKKNKERTYKMAYDRFKGLSEEEKNKKREYPRNGYRNMSGK